MRIVWFILLLVAGVSSRENAAESHPEEEEKSWEDSLFISETMPQPQFSADSGDAGGESLTCSELYDQIKESDCAKPYFRFLKGASVKVGGSLNFSNLQIMSGDTLQASLDGLLTPAPYYSLSLASSFFGSTRFGYEFSLTYNSSMVLDQSIRRGETSRRFDLHTYSTISIAAVTPSVYFSIGGRDADPKTFFRLGLGLGAGWASVRGTAYFTEDERDSLCFAESTLLLEDGSTRQEVRDQCGLVSYKKSGLGGSARVFLDWRWHWLYGSFEVVELRLKTSQYEFHPADGLIKLAYILDI